MTHKAYFQKLDPNSQVTSSDTVIWPDINQINIITKTKSY